jgi:hypothetical protein
MKEKGASCFECTCKQIHFIIDDFIGIEIYWRLTNGVKRENINTLLMVN